MTTPEGTETPQATPEPGGNEPGNGQGAAPQANPASDAPIFVAKTQDELNAKFGSTRNEGRMSIVKDLGFDTIESLKSHVASHNQHLKAQKSEIQKAKEAQEASDKAAQEAQSGLRTLQLEREAEKQAIALGANPERVDALMKLRTPSTGEIDDQGNIVGDVLKDSMEQALAAYPEFKKAPTTVGGGSNPASGASETTLDTQIAEAQKAGDFTTVVALQMQKLTTPS